MKILFLLMRVRLLALLGGMFAKRKAKRSRAGVVLMILLFLYVVVALSGMIALFAVEIGGAVLPVASLRWFYFGLFGTMAFALMVVSGMFTAKGQLYDPKDNDLLLSLPVRPRDILASRMMLLYLWNLFFELPVMVPVGIVALAYGGATVWSVVFYLLSLVLLPLLALTFSCLLGFVLALVTSRVRNKTLFQTLVAAVFFGLYMYGCMHLSDGVTAIAENPDGVSGGLRYALPFFWMGRALGEGAWGAFGLFALVCVLPALLCVWLLSRSFLAVTIMAKQRRTVVYDSNKDTEKTRSASPLSAFVKKEIRHLFGSFTYLFNAGLGLLMMLVFAVLIIVKAEDVLGVFAQVSESLAASETPMTLSHGVLAAVVVLLGFFGSSMTLISAPSVSIEGKHIWLALSLPVSGALALRAKTLAHVSVTAGPAAIFVICASVALRCSVWQCLTALVTVMLYVLLTALVGTLFNVLWPKLDWLDEAVAVKQSGAVLVTMGVMVLAALLFGGGVLVLSVLIPASLANLCVSILLAGLCVGLWIIQEGPAGRAFARLGNL